MDGDEGREHGFRWIEEGGREGVGGREAPEVN